MKKINSDLMTCVKISDIYDGNCGYIPEEYEFVEFGLPKGRPYIGRGADGTVLSEDTICVGPRIVVRKVPKKVKVTRWMNVYKHQVCWHWESRARADAAAGERRIACLPFELEVDEGTVL